MYTKVSWLEGNSSISLPICQVLCLGTGLDSGRLRRNLPCYSYGLAGDFHPTSFEIYNSFINRFFTNVKDATYFRGYTWRSLQICLDTQIFQKEICVFEQFLASAAGGAAAVC